MPKVYAHSTKPTILIPEDTYLTCGEKLKPIFNGAGFWIEPCSMPVNAQKAKVAVFDKLHCQQAGLPKTAKPGTRHKLNGITYVVFPAITPDEIGDVVTFEKCLHLLSASDIPTAKIHVITNLQEFKQAVYAIREMNYVVADFETTCINPFDEGAKILVLGAGNRDAAYVMPMSHPESPWLGKRQQRDWLDEVYKVKKFVAFNAKFELRWFMRMGFPSRDVHFDPMVAHHMLHEWMPHSLDSLAAEYTEYGGYDYELNQLKLKNYAEAPLDVLTRYNGMDVLVTDLVMGKLLAEMEDEPEIADAYLKMERVLCQQLAEMEHVGMCLDMEKLAELNEWYDQKIEEFGNAVMVHKGLKPFFAERANFNFNSADQMRELLFDFMQFKPVSYTDPSKKYPKGVASVDKETMKVLISKGGKWAEALKSIQLRNRAAKIQSAFINVFERGAVQEEPEDGHYIRTTFNQHVVETFRLSSKDPNLQNLPRLEDLQKVGLRTPKEAFVSRFGGNGMLVQADFSQLELRVAAMYSGDEVLVRAYEEGRDLHGEMAERVYGKAYTKEERYKAKRTNFSAVFDIGAEALAEQIESTEAEAKELLRAFRRTHPTLFKWFDELWKKAQYDKFVTNFIGRKRHLGWEMDHAVKSWEMDNVRRSAYNFPIQSSAGDMMKKSMIWVRNDLVEATKRLGVAIIDTVHDSLIVDCRHEELPLVVDSMQDKMENLSSVWEWITVPVKVDISVGPNLADMKELSRDERNAIISKKKGRK